MTVLSPRGRRVHGRGLALSLALTGTLGCHNQNEPKALVASERTSAAAPEIAAPAMHKAANDPSAFAPMDATPSPDGSRIYFTAMQLSSDGEASPAVFATSANGGVPTALTEPAQLVAPVSIAVDLDGSRLFVADSAGGDDGTGAIMTVSTDGGSVATLGGTSGFAPNGVTVARVGKQARLYFTGRDPASGRAGAFQVGVGGGAPTALASGDAFEEPSGVAVDGNGVAYVVDGKPGTGSATLYRVAEGHATALASGIGLGFPAGVAVTQAGDSVLVSGLDPATRQDLVYVVNAASGGVSVVSKPFAGMHESAGLHRAHDANVFAWADSEANESGTVFVLEL